MTISVRPMRKEDVPQVNEIDREAFPTQLPPNYRLELQNQMARYIVACDDTRIMEEPEVKPREGIPRLLSLIKHWFNRSSDPAPSPPDRRYIVGFAGIWVLADEAHLTNIAVRSQYQGRGIGERLLITTVDLAKELKADTMTLEVRVSNTGAQNLYRKYGFKQVGLRRAYYVDNREDAMLMSTEIIASNSFQARLNQLKERLAEKGL
jgi:ribosomal-protein-alanine N-acetyltransferase